MRGKKSVGVVVSGRVNSKGSLSSRAEKLGAKFDKIGVEFIVGKPKEVMPQPKPKHKRHNKGLGSYWQGKSPARVHYKKEVKRFCRFVTT